MSVIFSPAAGDIVALHISGQVAPLSPRLENLERKGVDGHGYVDIGLRSGTTRLRVMKYYDGDGDADTGNGELNDMVGESISYTDAGGIIHKNMMVLRASPVSSKEYVLVQEAGVSAAEYPIVVEYEVILQKRI